MTFLFIDFFKVFDCTHRGKMEQIFLAYALPKETVTAIMMLYQNTKVTVCSPDGDRDFFDVTVSVLQGDTLDPYLFIICLDYVLQMLIDLMKENGFTLKKARSRWYPAETILTNTPTQAESLLHSLEQVAGGVGLHMNASKTEYIFFNQKEDISNWNGGSQKLLDKFTYLSSSVSSTESDNEMRLVKAWTAIDRLSII